MYRVISSVFPTHSFTASVDYIPKLSYLTLSNSKNFQTNSAENAQSYVSWPVGFHQYPKALQSILLGFLGSFVL